MNDPPASISWIPVLVPRRVRRHPPGFEGRNLRSPTADLTRALSNPSFETSRLLDLTAPSETKPTPGGPGAQERLGRAALRK